MNEKENIFIRFFKWIGLIEKRPVNKSEMCKQAQDICNKKCDECIWAEGKEE